LIDNFKKQAGYFGLEIKEGFVEKIKQIDTEKQK